MGRRWLTPTPAGTVALGPAGLDAITIESGVNARQALSIVFAACGGVVSGAGTGSVVIKGGNVATTRINASDRLQRQPDGRDPGSARLRGGCDGNELLPLCVLFTPYYFAPLGVPGPAHCRPGLPRARRSGPFRTSRREYFAASYFAPLASPSPSAPSSAPNPAIGATPYFSPWYFATSYFAPLAPPVPRGGAVPSSVQSPAIGAMPYISPSYFATSYFAPLAPPVPRRRASVPSSVPSPAIGATPYFSPTYFATSYFAPLAPPVSGGVVVAPGVGRASPIGTSTPTRPSLSLLNGDERLPDDDVRHPA